MRPVYPEEARKTRAHAVVTMRAFTGKTGAPGEIEVLSGDPMFVPAAITAVKQWRYDPCSIAGEPAEVRGVIEVPFTLDQ